MEKLEKYYTALKLRSQGKSYKEIGEAVGVSKKTAYEWCAGKRDVNKLKGLNRGNKVSDEEFTKIVKESYSIGESLRKQGLKPWGANYRGFHDRADRIGLDFSHFTGKGHLKNKKHNWASEIPPEKAFVKNGTLRSGNLKAKILKYELKEYICEICAITEWEGQPLSLHLDHINGVNNDNRLENLRFLCPNCHSLTETYCGKSKGINAKKYTRQDSNL